MTSWDLVHPELRPSLRAVHDVMPGGVNAIEDLTQRRLFARRLEQDNQPVLPEDLTIEMHRTHGSEARGGDEVVVRTYRPDLPGDTRPLVFFVHGGGMVMGTITSEDATAARLAVELGAVVVSVDYRLAPEHPYPCGLQDCYRALEWAVANAAGLGADPQRLVLYGGSAGGGLVLSLALLARDHDGPTPQLVMAAYPMIDDRHITPSSMEIVDLGAFDRAHGIEAWRWYLGGHPADAYAAPARATDLRNLPATYIDVGTADLFRDEDIAFAQRLMQAGVPTELHVYPGVYHAAEHMAPDAGPSQAIWANRFAALRAACARPLGTARPADSSGA